MLVALVGGLVLLTIGAALALHPIARWMVTEEASRQGVRLVFDDLSLSFGEVTLTRARASIDKVPHVVGEAPKVVISLQGWSVSAVHIDSARVAADGPVLETLKNLRTWRDTASFDGSLAVDAIVFSWVSGGSAWMTAQGSLLRTTGTLALQIHTLDAASLKLRDAHVVLANGTPTLLAVGAKDANVAPVKAYVTSSADMSTLKLTLPPTRAAALSQAFGVELPGKDASLEGEIGLKDADGPAPTSSIRMILKGYVPPHPREIDGMVAGGQTTLATTLKLDRATSQLVADDATVGVGSLVFKGKGNVEGKGTFALLHMTLHGSLACSALAQGAASTYAPGLLGDFVGGLAAATVQGSVAVTLQIEADSRKLGAAKIGTSVGVGCGFRGLSAD